MRLALPTIGALAVLGVLGLAPVSDAIAAGSLQVRVLDRDGEPLPEIAVYARPAAPGGAPGIAPGGAPGGRSGTASMNQRGLAFEPHILIVETGTIIDFPNSDDVRHHVYSFSPARAFDFSIESGRIHQGLDFDVAGLVTLGCNVHDDMLGFILVVDTPHFAKTDGDGVVDLAGLAAGAWELVIWTPRLAAKKLPAPVAFELGDGQQLRLEQRFTDKLYPPHAHSETSLHWSHY